MAVGRVGGETPLTCGGFVLAGELWLLLFAGCVRPLRGRAFVWTLPEETVPELGLVAFPTAVC